MHRRRGPPPNPEERRRTAFHEAGHFVVAHALDFRALRVEAISLYEDGPHSGQLHLNCGWLSDGDMVQLCTVLAAGFEAETLLVGWPNRAAAATDLRQLREICSDFFEYGIERVARLEKAFHLRASILLRRHWAAVQGLAGALETKRYMSAHAARIVLEASGLGCDRQ